MRGPCQVRATVVTEEFPDFSPVPDLTPIPLIDPAVKFGLAAPMTPPMVSVPTVDQYPHLAQQLGAGTAGMTFPGPYCFPAQQLVTGIAFVTQIDQYGSPTHLIITMPSGTIDITQYLSPRTQLNLV